MIRTALVALAALNVIGVANVASAQEFSVKTGFSIDPYVDAHQTKVGFKDVDLSTASGARVALTRIQRAAEAVCGGQPNETSPHIEKEDFANCYADAVRVAADDARAPLLSAMAHQPSATYLARN